jgi:signal peptidase I
MLPTLLPGDLVLLDHRAVTPRRGELVVFEPKRGGRYEVTGFSVKRVVAVEGDVVETRDHEVLVNGAALAHVDRPCAPGTADPGGGHCVLETLSADRSYGLVWHEARHEAWGPSTLGPGEVFVLGDNRDNSLDSRHLGLVQRSEVRGRVVAVWFSWGEGSVRWSRIGREL